MSSPASELPSVGHLDRANFTVDDQAGRHITAPRNENLPRPLSASRRCDDKPEESSTSPSSFANVRRVSHKVRSKLKTKTHKILPTSQEDHEPEQTQTAPALAPAPATTADDDRLFRSAREHKGLQAKDLLHNPIDTVSSLVRDASGAKVAAVMDNQVIAHGADGANVSKPNLPNN